MFNQWSLYNNSYIMKKIIFIEFFFNLNKILRQKYERNNAILFHLTRVENAILKTIAHILRFYNRRISITALLLQNCNLQI